MRIATSDAAGVSEKRNRAIDHGSYCLQSLSATSAGRTPMAMAVSTARSAASRWRTEAQRRSQRLSVA